MPDLIRTTVGELMPRDLAAEKLTRRAWLRGAVRSAAVLTAGTAAVGLLRPAARAGGEAPAWDYPGMSPEITPVGQFYTISKNLFDPVVAADGWRLGFDGLLHRHLSLDYETLTASRPAVGAYVTLACISNEVGGELIGNAHWRGIRLRDVLADAGVQTGAVDVVMEGEDGYTDSIPIEKAMDPDTLLVWEMNGEPLAPEHGFPARIIAPGLYGIKNVKWVRRISVVDHVYKGYWQERGWSDDGTMKTWSRFDLPGGGRTPIGEGIVVGGVAHAGDRGIAAVEYSVDGGASWRQARAKESLSPYAWSLWMAQWKPQTAGTVRLVVRAVDGTGEVQPAEPKRALPDGAEGLHGVELRVV